MAITEIRLDGPEVTNYRIEGRQVWIETAQYESVVRVPRVVRSTFWKHGKRAVLRAGSVTISGPHRSLLPLWEHLCDTQPTK